MQEHLARVLPARRTTGLFGPQTLGDLRAFQARRRLPITGRTDPATWRALLRLPVVAVSWTGVVARSAGAAGGGRARGGAAPASASLRALAHEIPDLGGGRSTVGDPR
jgi:peptidoglycan hydrolase-like protein with peptidoglycan-binding domain